MNKNKSLQHSPDQSIKLDSGKIKNWKTSSFENLYFRLFSLKS